MIAMSGRSSRTGIIRRMWNEWNGVIIGYLLSC